MSVVEASRGLSAEAAEGEPSHEVLLERARVIARNARARAAETEAARSVPAVTIDEIRRAGLMRILTPRQWGGLGRSFGEFCELTYELAQGCASTGWVYAVLAGHAQAIIDYPPTVQEEVWGDDPDTFVSSAFAPTGLAEPVSGGYRLSGRFPFASGSDHALWAVVGGMAPVDGGGVIPRLFLVRRSDLATIDDWRTVGLSGTGSKSLVAKDVFVPTDWVCPFAPLDRTAAPLGLQSAMVGAARGGVESFIQETKAKTAKWGFVPPAQSEHYQVEVGQALGDVTSAWMLLNEVVRRFDAVPADGAAEDFAKLMRAVTGSISRLAVCGLERLFELSGGHGAYDGDLSRAYRDVRTAFQHPALNTAFAGKQAGSYVLTAG